MASPSQGQSTVGRASSVRGPCPATEVQAGTIVAHGAPCSMISETRTSQPRTVPCPRRFVVIYRRRHPEVIEGPRITLGSRDDLPVSQTIWLRCRAAAWRWAS